MSLCLLWVFYLRRYGSCVQLRGLQPRRLPAGQRGYCARPPADRVGLEAGAGAAALQGLLPGGVQGQLLSGEPRAPHQLRMRTHQASGGYSGHIIH